MNGIEAPDVPPRRLIGVMGEVIVGLDRREMWRDDKWVKLSPNEGLLLSTFLENRGCVLTHQGLVLEVKREGVAEEYLGKGSVFDS